MEGIYGLIIIKVPAWLHYWAFILPGLVKFDIPAEELFSGILARACGVPVGRRSGGRLAMTEVATINVIIFSLFFSFFSLFLFFSFLIEGVLALCLNRSC